jgi:hypothetical protein
MIPTVSTSKIILPRPHSDGQYELIYYPGSIALLAGRRYGKTLAGVERLLRCTIETPGLYWWVGLSWKSASMKRAWRMLCKYGRQIWEAAGLDPDNAVRKVEREVRLPNGAEIWLRTAENPESLAGEGVRGAVIDEFTLMRESVWSEFLEPTTLDWVGSWVLMMGVPKGENWAARQWYQAAGRANWIQRHYTTYDNPLIDRARIEDIRRNTPQVIFEQEYLAEITGGGAVFRNVENCVYGPPGMFSPPDWSIYDKKPDLPKPHYIAAADWGQLQDYTVVDIMERDTKTLVDTDRYYRMPWTAMRDRMINICRKWRAEELWPEENSIGSPNIEELRKDKRLKGVRIRPFMMTHNSKMELVHALMSAFENGKIKIPDDPVLLGELRSVVPIRLPSGAWRYEAASGAHDDTVVALMIAYHACQRRVLMV